MENRTEQMILPTSRKVDLIVRPYEFFEPLEKNLDLFC